MKSLVTSAFLLTLLLSAVTVFFALKTDSLDGEPYATIQLAPPKVATRAPAPEPVPAPKSEPVAATPTETSEPTTDIPSTAAQKTTTIEPASEPATRQETDDASGATLAPAEPDNATTPRPKRPIVVQAAPLDDPVSDDTTTLSSQDLVIQPAADGLGLGVGNLGSLSSN